MCSKGRWDDEGGRWRVWLASTTIMGMELIVI